MSLISLIINIDSRPERKTDEKMFSGVVDRDFLDEGVFNKKIFFKGFDFETIIFIDEHLTLSENELNFLKQESDTLIIRKHNKKFEDQENFAPFNDLNYLTALFAARGKYIFHFDGDVAAFSNSKEAVNNFMKLLEQYDYVSYPSYWSPNPVEDASFEGKYFCSTRFFCCKRSTLNFGEILKCQLDYDYWRNTYPVPRLCHWTEHIISSISWNTTGRGVYYPPYDIDNYLIFTWGRYDKYILQRLNNIPYNEVVEWVKARGIHYPNNVFA